MYFGYYLNLSLETLLECYDTRTMHGTRPTGVVLFDDQLKCCCCCCHSIEGGIILKLLLKTSAHRILTVFIFIK